MHKSQYLCSTSILYSYWLKQIKGKWIENIRGNDVKHIFPSLFCCTKERNIKEVKGNLTKLTILVKSCSCCISQKVLLKGQTSIWPKISCRDDSSISHDWPFQFDRKVSRYLNFFLLIDLLFFLLEKMQNNIFQICL